MILSPLIRMVGLAAVMTGFLVIMLGGHLDRRANGTEVRMAMTTYDPRDFFMGHYSILSTELRILDTSELAGDDAFGLGDEIFAILEASEDNVWRPVSMHRERPSAGVVIRGRVNYVTHERDIFSDDPDADPVLRVSASFNIERLYNPRERAQTLDRLLREGGDGHFLILSIPTDGNAVIKAIEIDGVREEYRLF